MDNRSASPERWTHIVIGGGSSGCVVAARLSENAKNRVLLIEAGMGYKAENPPADIAATYGGRALVNPAYFWPGLRVRRSKSAKLSEKGRAPFFYEQARLLGGGSSINGQVALRGLPADYDGWKEAGAEGWDWESVLPHFRKLESDAEQLDQSHGLFGPIAIRRVHRDKWDKFTQLVTHSWEAKGLPYLQDLNGLEGEGFGPIPLSNDGSQRVSVVRGYLTADVVSRRNLDIFTETRVEKIIFEGTTAVGVRALRLGIEQSYFGSRIILCAGSIHTPWLLQLSGVGPGSELRKAGIEIVADRPGVGQNLQEHPGVSVSAYLRKSSRQKPIIRRNYSYLRYSSRVEGCEPVDMVSMAVCQSAWHAVGARIATITTFIGRPVSRGSVRLTGNTARHQPDVDFNWLSDERDMRRATQAFQWMASLLLSSSAGKVVDAPFASSFSERVRSMSTPGLYTSIFTRLAALSLDWTGPLRSTLVDRFVSEAQPLQHLLSNPEALESYLLNNVIGGWHPAGTCKMGRSDDKLTVTDPAGRVLGTDNLYVADASIMPVITRTNTNIPSIMIGEKIAAGL